MNISALNSSAPTPAQPQSQPQKATTAPATNPAPTPAATVTLSNAAQAANTTTADHDSDGR